MSKGLKKLTELLGLGNFVFVDIGAAGDFDRRWKALGDHLSVIGFEPGEKEFKKLIEKNSNKNVTYHNCCVAKERSTLNYFVCRQPTGSSCFRPNFDFLNRFPENQRFEVVNEVSLAADSLDNILGFKKVDFIKIDTQGSELNILEGARNALKGICGLEVEVEFSPHYEKQPLFADIDSYLRSSGFSLFDLKPCYWKRALLRPSQGRGQIAFADALYIKDFISLGEVPQCPGPVITASVIYQKYGFALELIDYFSAKGKLDHENKEKIKAIILSLSKPLFKIPDFRGRMKLVAGLERILGLLKSAYWARYDSWR